MSRGRIANVRLSPEQVTQLQEGRTVKVRLPKDVALLQISLVDGERLAEFWSEFDRFFAGLDKLMKKLPFRK